MKNFVLKKSQVYQLKVVVNGNNVKCYIDDALYVDYTKEAVFVLPAGDDLGLVNSFEEPEKVAPTESTISVGKRF